MGKNFGRTLSASIALVLLAGCLQDEATAPVVPRVGEGVAALSGQIAGGVILAPVLASRCGGTFSVSKSMTSSVAYYWRATGKSRTGFALATASQPVYFDASDGGAQSGVTVFSDPARTLRFGAIAPAGIPCVDASSAPVAKTSIVLAYVCENTWRVRNSNALGLILNWAAGAASGALGTPPATGSTAASLYFDAGAARTVTLRHRGVQVSKVNAPVLRPPCTGPSFPTATVQVVAGQGQLIVVGDTLPTSPRIRIATSAGTAIQGATVSASIASGYGFFTNVSAVTDGNGEVTLGAWELSETGPHALQVAVSGVPASNPSTVVNASARDLTWTLQTTPGENLMSIWGTSPNALFVSGGYRTLNFWDGTAWTAMAHPSGANRYRVHGRSLTDVYSVGQWGAIHFDGTSWAPSLNAGAELIGIWVAPDGQAFASGDGTFWHFDGSSWIKEPTGLSEGFNVERLESTWGSSPTNVYAVGRNGLVLRWDGAVVHQGSTGFTDGLITVFGFGPNDVYVTDAGGGVVHYDGASWSRVAIAPGVPVVGIWGSSPRNLYVNTSAGDVWRFDGRSWQMTATLGLPLGALFGFDAGHVYSSALPSTPGLVFVGM